MAKTYRKCPNPRCGKKGVYKSNGYPYWGDGTECCRYCTLVVRPGRTDEQAVAALEEARRDFMAGGKNDMGDGRC